MQRDPRPAPVRAGARPIRVLVVDDQSFMRIALRQMLEAEGDICVVGEARNGVEAVAMAKELRPDAITLDVEMPEMDGLEACAQIMRMLSPAPAIIMVSAHTQAGAESALKALRCGAVDFVSKSSAFAKTDLAHIDSELRLKLRAWVKRPTGPERRRDPTVRPATVARRSHPDLVVIAASTGGPQALTKLLTAAGPIRPPIVIAQHMPEFFTASLAHMLTYDTGCNVQEGENRRALTPYSVTLIPGGRDAMIAPHRGGGYELRLIRVEANVHPCADSLFESAALVGAAALGIVLTGMGEDGAKGAAALRRKDVPVLVQEPASCIVDGMPQAALAAASGCEIMTIDEIAERLSSWGLPEDRGAGRAPAP